MKTIDTASYDFSHFGEINFCEVGHRSKIRGCPRSETTCHSERPTGAKNPSSFELFGSKLLETLHFVQGDIIFFVFEVRQSPKLRVHGFLSNFHALKMFHLYNFCSSLAKIHVHITRVCIRFARKTLNHTTVLGRIPSFNLWKFIFENQQIVRTIMLDRP